MNRPSLILGTLVLGATLLRGSMEFYTAHEIDFTKPKEAAALISIEPANRVTLTDAGLGRDGANNGMVDGSFITTPIAVGFSWRTLSSITLTAELSPPPQTLTLPNGQSTTPWRGQVFARYSPDRKHWSSWTALPVQAEPKPTDKALVFRGLLEVPHRARKHYSELLRAYAKLDVPWQSDEEAAVKWMLTKEPEFFAKEQPFIGYVQFLYEAPFYGGQRLKAFRCTLGAGVGGMATIPRDKSAQENRDGPWRFDASGGKAAE